MSENERRHRYARAIWAAMVNDEPPPKDDTLWREGYEDAADAAIALADAECREAVEALRHVALNLGSPNYRADPVANAVLLDYAMAKLDRLGGSRR